MKIIHNLPEDSVIVTGDANGVDVMVESACLVLGRKYSKIYSKQNNWEEGYKKRNHIIAEYCDRVISIALPVTDNSDQLCYHCNREDHQKTAGCYTGKVNGNYEVIILEK